MFCPGETVIHNFVIPFNVDDIKKILVSYKQKNNIVLEKEVASEDISSADPENEEVTEHQTLAVVELLQEETLLFTDKAPFTVQLNVLTQSTRHTSAEMKDSSGVQYHREVMSNV